MTNQEAFNIVVTGLRKQGEPSIAHGTCLYRHPDGIKKCAIGFLIPDDEYKPSFDGPGIYLSDIIRQTPALGNLDEYLLADLQLAHDYGAAPFPWLGAAMEYRYHLIASKYHLTVPPIEATHATAE